MKKEIEKIYKKINKICEQYQYSHMNYKDIQILIKNLNCVKEDLYNFLIKNMFSFEVEERKYLIKLYKDFENKLDEFDYSNEKELNLLNSCSRISSKLEKINGIKLQKDKKERNKLK